jgi:hypothetical protein
MTKYKKIVEEITELIRNAPVAPEHVPDAIEWILDKPRCPYCGDAEHYRIVYNSDTDMTDIKFYDCMMCHTHWDKDGKNLGKF